MASLYTGVAIGVIEFDWDDANVKHLASHRITPSEFEQAMTVAPEDIGYQCINGEDRYQVVGPTNAGRLLYLVWTPRGDTVRAVTAYPATKTLQTVWKSRKR
jgi:uncharacterized protein